jgi:transcriptional regulator with XRE-family HTH domain
MTEDPIDLGERADALIESHNNLLRDLIKMRTLHNLSQESVAERMGVTQPTVAAFERYDANPTLSTIRRYALAVGAEIAHTVIDNCASHSRGKFEAVISNAIKPTWSATHPTGRWSAARKMTLTHSVEQTSADATLTRA